MAELIVENFSMRLCGNSKCPLSDKCTTEVLEESSCPAKAKLKDALRMYFHFDTFQAGQLESLLPLAHGKDVFVHIPTDNKHRSVCVSRECTDSSAARFTHKTILGMKTIAMYHASLTQAYKQSLQQEFMSEGSTLRCLVATVAFGMVGMCVRSCKSR